MTKKVLELLRKGQTYCFVLCVFIGIFTHGSSPPPGKSLLSFCKLGADDSSAVELALRPRGQGPETCTGANVLKQAQGTHLPPCSPLGGIRGICQAQGVSQV